MNQMKFRRWHSTKVHIFFFFWSFGNCSGLGSFGLFILFGLAIECIWQIANGNGYIHRLGQKRVPAKSQNKQTNDDAKTKLKLQPKQKQNNKQCENCKSVTECKTFFFDFFPMFYAYGKNANNSGVFLFWMVEVERRQGTKSTCMKMQRKTCSTQEKYSIVNIPHTFGDYT